MLERFQGEEGRRRLIEAVKGQRLVEHDEALAAKLADRGELVHLLAGDTIMMQGASDNDVYMILAGEADIYVNLRYVATRRPRETVGEMAILDPTALRSATVIARSEMVTFRVSEPTMHALAEEYPRVWRVMAQIVAERLRERGTFLNTPNQRPVLFIGCSAEALPIAEEIALGLKHANIDAVPWNKGVFGASGIPLDDLLRAVEEADFAAFVFAPDDKVISRGEERDAPRDNTVFELGLFMGKLARNRCFIVKESSLDIKIPSDLLGITPITYIISNGTRMESAIGTVCTEIKKTILSIGVR